MSHNAGYDAARGGNDDRNDTPGGAARKVYVHTFGCQMNVYDSRRMVQVLGERHGRPDGRHVETREPAEADLILINTCSVREKPFAKVRSTLGRYAQLRAMNPELLIGVTGCVAAQEKDRLLGCRPGADFVLGPDNLADLPDVVDSVRASREGVVRADALPIDGYPFVEARPLGDEGVSAMVTAMKGCDSFCSYCIVPYVRGREVSKPSAQVLDEVRRYLDAGVREVMLLGQNVNRFGMDRDAEMSFAELLRSVGALPGLERLLFTTSHPRDFSDELIRCFAEIPALCDYLHLPFQAGSDAVLARMNRGYTRARYLELVERLRSANSELHLSADAIVGFPGETDADFQDTLSLLKTVRFASLYSFQYSPRPGTKAAQANQDEAIPADVRAERLRVLQASQQRITEELLAEQVGRTVEVLVEGASRRGPKRKAAGRPQLMGRSRARHIVNFDAPDEEQARALVGRLVRVRIAEACGHSLRGELVAVEAWPRGASSRREESHRSRHRLGEEDEA